MAELLMFDGRAHQRRAVPNTPAWIEGSNGVVVECTLSNVSHDGAMLMVSKDFALPGRFALRLTQDGRIKRGCRLIWRNGDRTGVRFFEFSAPHMVASEPDPNPAA